MNFDEGLIGTGDDVPSCALLTADEGLARRMATSLTSRGWRVVGNTDLAAADLLVLDSDYPLPWPAAQSIPRIILSAGRAPKDWSADEIIPKTLPSAELNACIDLWRPTPDAQSFQAVVGAFGSAALRPIVFGLSDTLKTAIEGLGLGMFERAHSIAGLAGTLGFGRVSAAWIAINMGDVSDVAGARREARLATIVMDRWLAATGSGRDSAG